VRDAAYAGVQSHFEDDGHGWRCGGESDALGDRFIVAFAELGGDGPALVDIVCVGVLVGVGRRGGHLPGIEFENCTWVICLFEVWHRFANEHTTGVL
jgi:hypothetical protein